MDGSDYDWKVACATLKMRTCRIHVGVSGFFALLSYSNESSSLKPARWMKLSHRLHCITSSSSLSRRVFISLIEYVLSVWSSGDSLAPHCGQGKSPLPSILAKSTWYSRSSFVFIFRFFFFSIFFTSKFYEQRATLQSFRAKQSSQKGYFALVWQSRVMLRYMLFPAPFVLIVTCLVLNIKVFVICS